MYITKTEALYKNPEVKFYTRNEARKLIFRLTGCRDYETITEMVRECFYKIKDDTTYVYKDTLF
jgi:hypothetical protein